MLETIKTLLDEPEEPFNMFYQEYVNTIQDNNLDREVMHLNVTSQKDQKSVLECLNNIQRGLKDEFFEGSKNII